MSLLLTNPDQTACFGRLTARSSLAAGPRHADSSRAPACTLEAAVSSLSPTPMFDLNKIHSCSGLVKLECRKPSMLVSGGKGPSSSIESYRSRATVAALRVPLTPYRPRRVAAMDHPVTVGCSPRTDVLLSHHRAALRFWVLDAVQEDDNLA